MRRFTALERKLYVQVVVAITLGGRHRVRQSGLGNILHAVG